MNTSILGCSYEGSYYPGSILICKDFFLNSQVKPIAHVVCGGNRAVNGASSVLPDRHR